MTKRISILTKICFVSTLSLYIFSCSKKDSSPTPPANPCAGKTIVITPTIVSPTTCGNGGSITIAASGSTNFNYKLNSGGTYQASSLFDGLSAGTYTVFVKDGVGCEKSTSVTVSGAGNAGPLFIAVKNLMASKCQSCHNNSVQNGVMNWEVDCNIVTHKANIKNRAIDLGTMPPTGPLSASEKDIITNWITAGGNYTD